MSTTTDLLDVNVWVALAFPGHDERPRALDYWNQKRGERIAFCSPTMMGMTRLLTNPAVMKGRPYSASAALAKYRDFSTLPEADFLHHSSSVERWLAAWLALPFFTGKLWTDAWIAALAMENGCRVVSFDSDFSKFPGLDFLHLAP